MASKYLSKVELSILDKYVDPDIELITNDTIDEGILRDVVEATGRGEELLVAAIQIAIVGQGNRKIGDYKYKGEVKDMKVLFDEVGVKYNNVLQANLDPADLTPRRLTRIFRNQIKMYLEGNVNTASYLYHKYSLHNVDMRTICFPGAEHLVETSEEIEYILEAYLKLDTLLMSAGRQSGISDRVKRVLLARGKLTVQL